MLAAAQRCSLVCVDDVPFDAAAWQPHYQLRRHHTGRSFQRRIGASRHYCFRRTAEAGGGNNLFRLLSAAVDNAPASLPLTGATEVVAYPSTSLSDPSASLSDPSAPAQQQPTRKRRKMDAAVAGAGGYVAAGPGCWACQTCGKELSSERGARTHVYMVHVLGQGSAPVEEGAVPDGQGDEAGNGGSAGTGAVTDAGGLSCAECGRAFAHADAIYQVRTPSLS